MEAQAKKSGNPMGIIQNLFNIPPKISRIEFIDVAKCITIFLVIWGHTATNAELTGNPSLLYKMLYSFHMPLFFMLSGLSMSVKPLITWASWKAFLKKNIICLVVPYLIWALIYCNFSFDNLGQILTGSWQALTDTGSLTSLWFLAALFVARILVNGILALEAVLVSWNLYASAAILALPFMAIGVLLSSVMKAWPWCIDIAFVAAGFILLGYALKSFIISLMHKKSILITALFVSAAAFVLVNLYVDNPLMFMADARYGNHIVSLVNALTGSVMVLSLSMLIVECSGKSKHTLNKQPFIAIGKHTMGIFLLHKPMMQMLIIPQMETVLTNSPQFVGRLLSAIIAFFISIVLCLILQHFIPQLIGQMPKPSKENN